MTLIGTLAVPLQSTIRSELDKRRREAQLAEDAACSRFPLRRGHHVSLLRDGPETFDAMMASFDAAQTSIHVMSYAFNHGEVGKRFAESLVRARQRGVSVRLLYDWMGSFDCSRTYFDALERAGILIRCVRAPHRNLPRGLAAINRRNHRKIAIVDGYVGFVGGVNITESYRRMSRVLRHSGHRAEARFADDAWRDTHLKLCGPAARDLETIFLEDWLECSSNDLSRPVTETKGTTALLRWAAGSCSTPERHGASWVRVVTTAGAGHCSNEPFDMYANALQRARESVQITHAYFAPPRWLLDDVCAASRRGVDVRIVVPGRSDNPFAFYASRSNYSRLLRAGARLYEMQDCFLHAKTMVVDGWWSIVGSTNLDMRSWLHNDETCVVVYDEPFAQRMQAQFEADLGSCQPLSLRRWRRRRFTDRLRERAMRAVYHWL